LHRDWGCVATDPDPTNPNPISQACLSCHPRPERPSRPATGRKQQSERQYLVGGGVSEGSNSGRCEGKDRLVDRDDQANHPADGSVLAARLAKHLELLAQRIQQLVDENAIAPLSKAVSIN